MPRTLMPRKDEPIRLVEPQSGARYRVVMTTSPKGAPRKQTTRTFETLPEARRFVTHTRAQLARGDFAAPSKLTLRGLAESWLSSRRDIRAISLHRYETVLAPVVARLGHRKAQSITRRDVEGLVEHLVSAGRSQRTVVYTLGALRQVLAFGVSDGTLSQNPAKDVRPPRRKKGDRRVIRPWEPEDLTRFRTAADAEPLYYAVAFRLTLCGLRRSEVLGLAWEDVDLDAGTVRIKAGRVPIGDGRVERDDAKSEASERTVPVEVIEQGTLALLRALRKQQMEDRLAVGPAYGLASETASAPEDVALVVVDALGLPVHPDAYTARFRAVSKRALLPAVGMHSVRHALALRMHRLGVAPADAASLLGHTVGTHLTFYVPKTSRGADSAASVLGEANRATG